MPTVTILLVDDHAMFRTGVALVLRAGIADVEVLEQSSVEEAMRSTMPAPDVLLLDIRLQGLNGLEAIALFKRKWPLVPIVMLSSDAASATVQQALARGATAFVSKAESADHILALINQVLRRDAIVTSPRPDDAAPGMPACLTPRQCEVLDLLHQGLSNKLIGRRLGLSENTVRGHVQAVLEFFQVTSRSEAAYVARQRGLVG